MKNSEYVQIINDRLALQQEIGALQVRLNAIAVPKASEVSKLTISLCGKEQVVTIQVEHALGIVRCSWPQVTIDISATPAGEPLVRSDTHGKFVSPNEHQEMIHFVMLKYDLYFK